MNEQQGYLGMFVRNIENCVEHLRVKQIRFDFSLNDDGQTEVDVIAEDENGIVIAQEIAIGTFSEAIKYLDEHIS